MKILQGDIFGNAHKTTTEKEKKQSLAAPAKPFKDITITDGINENNAASEAMLIHRVLQKKIIYAGLATKKQREIFLKILENELNIKAGKKDPCTLTRDSLIAFFGR